MSSAAPGSSGATVTTLISPSNPATSSRNASRLGGRNQAGSRAPARSGLRNGPLEVNPEDPQDAGHGGHRLPHTREGPRDDRREHPHRPVPSVELGDRPRRIRVARGEVRAGSAVDVEVEVRPVQGQVDHLLGELRAVTARGERALVTTLTKRTAEDLTEYLVELGVRARYLHSEIETLDRVDILRDLRLGKFDVLVGINLLREGLDLPEVSLVAILDADKEGFLRSATSLIQTIGRAARNMRGKVILYADQAT